MRHLAEVALVQVVGSSQYPSVHATVPRFLLSGSKIRFIKTRIRAYPSYWNGNMMLTHTNKKMGCLNNTIIPRSHANAFHVEHEWVKTRSQTLTWSCCSQRCTSHAERVWFTNQKPPGESLRGGSLPSQMLSLEKRKKREGRGEEEDQGESGATDKLTAWYENQQILDLLLLPRRAVQKDSWTQVPPKCKTQKEYIPACSTKIHSLTVLHSLICIPGGLVAASTLSQMEEWWQINVITVDQNIRQKGNKSKSGQNQKKIQIGF